MKSKVAFLKVNEGENAVQNTVKKAMELCNWKEYITGDKIFIKINAVSDLPVPGQNTSPWVLDGVLNVITEGMPDSEIIVGDANTASHKQLDKSNSLWGFSRIAKRYGVKFKNLSNDTLHEIDVEGKYLHTLLLPETVITSDSIVTVPVMKCHTWAKITCSLKNQFGCIPQSRHVFHLFLDDVIVDINSFLRPSFSIVDGTIGLENGGPVMGKPKVCDVIIAAHDLVAADTVVTKFMGFDPYEIPYIKLANDRGIGNMNEYEIIGTPFTQKPFIRASDNIVSYWHKKLRMSFLEPILFRTSIFDFLSWLSTGYQRLWYKRYGTKYAKQIFKDSWYAKQFANEFWRF
jgi:uncharacterized protein (DUF362 family)